MNEQDLVANPVTDSDRFRDVLGHFCSGITIVGAHDGSRPVGLTCQSFFSVSLDPPLVAFSVSRTSTSFPVIRSIGSLVINVLAIDQREISDAFARAGTDKWRGVAWSAGKIHGHPVIDGVVASLECEITDELECGDHVLILARVWHLEAQPTRWPLLYYRGSYHGLQAMTASEGTE